MQSNHLHLPKMYLSILSVLFIFTILSLTGSCAPSGKAPPKAVKGVLDLRDWDPSAASGIDPSTRSGIELQGIEDQRVGNETGQASGAGSGTVEAFPSESSGKKQTGIIKLDGEWEFYWKEFPALDEKGVLHLPEDKREYIDVPRSWNGKVVVRKTESGELIEETLGAEGYATYKLKILLGKGGKLAFRVPHQGTAYTLYANNKVISKLGEIGKTSEESKPSRINQYLYIDLPPDIEELNLTLSISNFHNRSGGIWLSCLIGNENDIHTFRYTNLSIDLFITGILFIMGIYHLSLYTLRREDRSPLYFGIYCLLITLRTLLTGERYLHSIFPNLSYSVSLSLEYLTLYLGIPIFLEFINSLYPKEMSQIYRKNIIGVQGFLSSLSILLPPLYFTKTLPIVQFILLSSIIYAIFILIKAFMKRREGAKTFLAGFLIFALVITNDLLHYNQIINTGLYTPLGLVAFIFSQSFLLTSRFANAFRQVKDLTLNLEKKVEERTKTLEEAIETVALANQEIFSSRKDTEELNELIKNINSVSSLTDVMMYLMFYLETNYAYNSFWLVLYDKQSNLLQTSFCVSSTLSKDAIEYLKNLSFHPEDPLSICSTYREQKLVYRDKEDSLLSEYDKDILDKAEFSYLFHLPFVIYGECIGMLTLHKADGERIPLTEQEKMSRFTDLISGAVYNSILFRDSQLAKEKAEESFQKANTLNEMVQVIIQSKSTDEIFTKIYDLFSVKYGLTSYIVYTYDNKDQLLKLYKLYGDIKSSKDYLITLSKNHLSIQDRYSFHGACFKLKKSFLVKSIKLPHKYKLEEENIIEGGITSFYIIPLITEDNSFGCITFGDNKFQASNIKGLTKTDREEIENFIKLISPSIYQSLQKNIIEKAYSELQTTKSELESQKAQMERLHAMSQEIQRKTSFEDMLHTLAAIVWESYQIGDYALWIYNSESNELFSLSLAQHWVNHSLVEKIRNIPMSDRNSIHKLVFEKKRSLFLPKFRNISSGYSEDNNREQLGMESLFAIPCIVNNESFAVLSFSDLRPEYSKDPFIRGVKRLTPRQRDEIEQLVSLIANPLYQSLQKQKIEKAYSELDITKSELESQKAQMERLQEMSQDIQRKTNFDEMLRLLEDKLWSSYGLGDFTLFILKPENNQLQLYTISQNLKNLGYLDKLKNISLSELDNFHKLVFDKKRSLFLPKLRNIPSSEEEEYNRILLGMKSWYGIPCIVNDETFAVLSFSDIKPEFARDPSRKGVKNLTYKQRTEIEQLVALIANPLYQSLQKQKIEKAYKELQETQAQLVEAERMASLGQLVGGIAHEINNPIAVIRSHAELLAANNRTTLRDVPVFLETLTSTEKNIFYEIVDSSIKNRVFLNSKEERKQRKELEQELSDLVQEEDLRTTLAESIVQLRLPPPYRDYIEELGGARFASFLSRAEVFKNQANSISSIDIAVEKATRVVFALRNYLNTQLFSEKKEVDLVTELEKALHVYDNYVMGKINIRKEFPRELKYFCVTENLLQVWKNIIFNAIQAMYTTDKKLEISLEKRENLPDSLKTYKTSNILEESIFQKEGGNGWVVVSITDSGSGIPSELQEKVFTPFFTTKALGEGIGLGLYICKKIVHEHGGALFFKSEGSSTEFLVVLPA